MTFHKMKKTQQEYEISSKNNFFSLINFSLDEINSVLFFSYQMAFTDKGEHRKRRSGGQHNRKPGEIFADTFQGKLAEIGVKKFFNENGLECGEINFETWQLGKWDTSDLEINGKKINIKSSKHFANLLLLEVKDWDEQGLYLPNSDSGNSKYDYFIFVRIKPVIENIMKKLRLYYSSKAELAELKESIEKENWSCDIPGYITLDDLRHIIKENFINVNGARRIAFVFLNG